MGEDPMLPPIDRRTLLKVAGAAGLGAPGLSLLQGFTADGAVARAAGAGAGVAPAPPTVTLAGSQVRPPSIPLAVRSPYLSTWLPATSLTATTPQFWRGAPRTFVGLALIDGRLYAWAGDPVLNGTAVTAMTPVSTEVTATRSIFTAVAGGVQLVAEWLSPVEPGDLERQSAPLTLLTVSVSSTDNASHSVQVYADISGEWATSDESAQITWQTTSDTVGRYWAIGLQTPAPLSENADMANWGQVVWAAPVAGPSLSYQAGYAANVRADFAGTGTGTKGRLSDGSDLTPPAVNQQSSNQPVFAFAFDFGARVGSTATSTSLVLGHVRTPLVAYGASATPLLPLWTNYWSGWQPMTAAFISGAASARQRAIALDQKIEGEATHLGGSGYAAACALALRQCYGGTELAIGPDGSPWLLGKEISSDGDTNTVDIFDQAFLAWLYLDPDLIPLVMAPILDWCASPAWQSPAAWSGIAQPYYCVHDLGVYPNPSGRPPGTAPNAGEQMPIEESAGMLIMAAAYANMVGAAAAAPFLSQWQALWTQWANYLMTQVPTPASQLCTDDWAPGYATTKGSVNLGIKAIIGLAAAAEIAEITGDTSDALTWANAATSNVGPWVTLSTDASSGDYLNLEQGVTGTWSSLYNAYYQSVIGLSLVPAPVASEQAAFYLNQLTTYGMPLQTGANNLNKVAWLFYLGSWLDSYPIAAELMSRNVAYINDTSSLVPYGDRYDTSSGVEVPGIRAHPTLGAVFALLAADASPLNALPEPPAQPPAPPPAPVVTVASAAAPKPKLTLAVSDGSLKLSGKDVSVKVASSEAAPCRGELKLLYTHEVTLRNHRRKRVNTVIAHANYALAPGSTRTVKLKLSAGALKLLKDAKRHRLAVLLEVSVKGGRTVSRHTTIHSSARR